jgi:hypothetical protein
MEEMMKIEERVMNTFLTYVHVYKWLKRVSEMSNCTYRMHRTAQGQRQIEREREREREKGGFLGLSGRSKRE